MLDVLYLFSTNATALLIAVAADMLVGDPVNRLHPARLTGWFIGLWERHFYADSVFRGGLAAVSTVIAAGALTTGLLIGAWLVHPVAYVGVSAVVIYFSISIKSLAAHARAVAAPLMDNDQETARQKLSMIVSRDTEEMDDISIARGAIESVGENFIDGVVAPVFFALLFGGVGAAVFKASSTLDSMLGYRTERLERFGRASARLDDMLCFIPARFAILFIALAALFMGQNWRGAWRVFSTERLNHASPNAGHGISAFAGALGVRLGGAAMYHGALTMKPVFNEEGAEPNAQDIVRAVKLMEAASLIFVLVSALSIRSWFSGMV